MKRVIQAFLTLSLAAGLILASCRSNVAELGPELESQIKDSLETIAVDFLRSWEPPFYPEKALGLFTQSEDFFLIIDGLPIGEYAEWAEGVPNFMSDDNYFFKSYTHEIKDIRTVVLSPDVGVVTLIYVWHSITKDDVRASTDGASTLTCRRENEGWKIVHYHGSHNE